MFMQVISAEIQDFYRKHSYSRTDLKFVFFFLFIFVSLLFFTLIYSLKILNFIANSIFSLIVCNYCIGVKSFYFQVSDSPISISPLIILCMVVYLTNLNLI